MSSKTFNFTLQIENFSLCLRRGAYTSPSFQENFGDRWYLTITSNEDVIAIFLNRIKTNDNQIIDNEMADVKLFVVDCFGCTKLCEEKSIQSTPECILSVEKKYLYGFCGLNRLRLVPNDTLTLKCEINTFDESIDTFRKRTDFENSSTKPESFLDVGFVQWTLRFFFLWALLLPTATILISVLYYIALFFVFPYAKRVIVPFVVSVFDIVGYVIFGCAVLISFLVLSMVTDIFSQKRRPEVFMQFETTKQSAQSINTGVVTLEGRANGKERVVRCITGR